jgi:hypothetical protein
MLLFTASVAVGLSAMQINDNCWFGSGPLTHKFEYNSHFETRWFVGLITTLIFWMILGLLYQVRDLLAFLKIHPQLDKEHKLGGAVEILWRLGFVVLFFLHALLAILLDREVFVFQEYIADFWYVSSMLREGVFALLLLAIVGSIPYVCVNTRSLLLYRVAGPLSFIFASLLCLLRWMNETGFHFRDALYFYRWDSNLRIGLAAFDSRQYSANARMFFWLSFFSGLMVVANGFFLNRLSRQWHRGLPVRLMWTSFLISGVAFLSCFIIWVLKRGLWQICPYFAEVGSHSTVQSWLAAALLLFLLTAISTYRMTADFTAHPDDPPTSWRIHADKYFSEWPPIILLLALISFLFWLMNLPTTTTFSLGPNENQISLEYFFRPVDFLWLALLLLILHRSITRRPDSNDPQADLPRINPAKFITIWLATAAFVVSGSLALVWMSFGLWFNPWFGGR